jgi:hypothetical protein
MQHEHVGTRRRTIALGVVVTMLLAACEPVGRDNLGDGQTPFPHIPVNMIRSVEVRAIPEGPAPARFSRNARGPDELAFWLVIDAIPRPLPRPSAQGSNCEIGTLVTFTLKDGTEVVYGPCRRPADVEKLRQAMMIARATPEPPETS